ncbi:MAG: lecithin retinol acyltransferase family protein [Vicinamibacterales bacterium]
MDERAALRRLTAIRDNGQYTLLGNNCEHFAREIVTGRRESTQVSSLLGVACVAGLFLFLSRAA